MSLFTSGIVDFVLSYAETERLSEEERRKEATAYKEKLLSASTDRDLISAWASQQALEAVSASRDCPAALRSFEMRLLSILESQEFTRVESLRELLQKI